MAEAQDTTDALLDKIDALSSLDTENTQTFVETALKNVRGELQSNINEAQNMTDRFGDAEVDDVLNPENVREIEVRAKPFENPKVTVWLKSCPIWANHAWRDAIYPNGISSYNSKVNTCFDVREF